MLTKIKTPIKFVQDFENEQISRLALHIEELTEAISNMQDSLFLIDMPIFSKQYPIIDKILYVSDEATGVSSNKSVFINPRSVGIGRNIIGNRAIISTVTHYSKFIKAGINYRLEDDSNTPKVVNNDQKPHITGLSDGVGLIHRINF